MNGEVFQGLMNLEQVYLDPNPCIDTDFDTPGRIRDIQQIVTSKCGFNEANSKKWEDERLKQNTAEWSKIKKKVVGIKGHKEAGIWWIKISYVLWKLPSSFIESKSNKTANFLKQNYFFLVDWNLKLKLQSHVNLYQIWKVSIDKVELLFLQNLLVSSTKVSAQTMTSFNAHNFRSNWS